MIALGNVVILSPEGDRVIGNRVVLDDKLRDGTVEDLLVVLEGGGRVAAQRATRTDGILRLDQAIYTPCPVTTPTGCPRKPSWSISAARVTRDPVGGRLRFEGGRLTILGITLPLLPVFAISDGSSEGAASGLLMPKLSVSTSNGPRSAFLITSASPTIRTSRSPLTSTPAPCPRSRAVSAISPALAPTKSAAS